MRKKKIVESFSSSHRNVICRVAIETKHIPVMIPANAQSGPPLPREESFESLCGTVPSPTYCGSILAWCYRIFVLERSRRDDDGEIAERKNHKITVRVAATNPSKRGTGNTGPHGVVSAGNTPEDTESRSLLDSERDTRGEAEDCGGEMEFVICFR